MRDLNLSVLNQEDTQLQKLLAQHPHEPRSFEQLARVAVQSQQWQLALGRWQTLLDLFPDNIAAGTGKGYALLELGFLEEAQSHFQTVIARHPDCDRGYEGYARVAMRSKQWQVALERWNELLQRSPQNQAALIGKGYCSIELAEFHQADSVFRELVERHPDSTAAWEGYARVAMRSKQHHSGLERWNQLLAVVPNHLPAQIGQGYCLMELGELERAETLFHTLAQQYPQHINVLEGYARVAMKWQRYHHALERWNQLLAVVPNHLPAQIGQGYCLMELGELERAETLFHALAQQDPQHINGLEGYARIAMRSKQYQSALERWEDILQQFPQHVPAQIGRAYCLMELGELRQAESIFQELTVQSPHQVEAAVGFAQIAMREEQWTVAVERWDRLIERFPDSTVAYTSKIGALLRLENFLDAESTLKKAYTQQPDSLLVLQSALHVAHYTNRWELLFEALDRAIARERDFELTWHPEREICKVFDNLFFLLSVDGKFSEARAAIAKLEAASIPNWKLSLWRSFIAREEGNYPLAVQLCQELLRQDLDPKEQNLVECQLLRYAYDDFDLTKTVELGNRLLPIASKAAFEGYQNTVDALIKLEREEEAKQFLRLFIDLYPSEALPYILLAQIFLFYEFNYGETLKTCNLAIRNGILTQRIYCYKALALSALDETNYGLQLLDRYLEKTLNSELIMMCRAQLLRDLQSYEDSLAQLNQILIQDGFHPIESTGSRCELNVEYLTCSPPETIDRPALVSVIMTTYCRDELLPVAIASILNQTYRNLELIIVDDCSPDDTYDFLQELADTDKRIKVLKLSCNSGTYVAKNVGMQYAKGDYITFMDADDWSHPQRIDRQVQTLENSEALAVTCGFFRIQQNSTIEFKPEEALGQAHITILFRTNPVLDTLGFFDAVRTGADTEHFCRIELLWGAGAIKRIKAPLLIATRHDRSITGGGSLGFPWYGPGIIDGLYAAAFKTWHRQIRHNKISAYIPHPLDYRRFEVSEDLLP